MSTAKFTGTLAVGATIGQWKYLGCAMEVNNRALRGVSYSDAKNMTVETCLSFCAKNNFPVVGLEYSQECYCGTALQSGATLGQKDCTMKCKGDSKEFCGGSNRLSVFNNTKYATPTPPAKIVSANDTWTYTNCYVEPGTTRALVNPMLWADNSMTAEKCTNFCGQGKYTYAGLEAGRECWCGTAVNSTVKTASASGNTVQCNMLCGGNQKQVCGGWGAITVYKASKAGKRDELVEGVRTPGGRFVPRNM